eukprot:jgi/Botrbrau1/12855/Bobra.0045s0024.1
MAQKGPKITRPTLPTPKHLPKRRSQSTPKPSQRVPNLRRYTFWVPFGAPLAHLTFTSGSCGFPCPGLFVFLSICCLCVLAISIPHAYTTHSSHIFFAVEACLLVYHVLQEELACECCISSRVVSLQWAT